MAANDASNVVLNFRMNGQVQYAQTLKQMNMVMQTASKEYQSQITAMGRNADATEKLRVEKKKLETQLAASSEKVNMLRDQFTAMQNDSSATAEDLQKLYNQVLAAETAHSKLGQAMTRVEEGLSEEAVASRKAKDELKSLTEDSKRLEAEKRRLTSAFEMQTQALGANATEAEKSQLALQQYQQQSDLMRQSVSNLETQIDKAKVAYGENSIEVIRLETSLNQARAQLQQFSAEFNRVPSDVDKAKAALKEMSNESKLLEAEQRKLISTFELERQELGANASEMDKAALAQRQYQKQLELSQRAITSLEQQLEETKRAYGENSVEVMQLETRLNQARSSLARFANSLDDVDDDLDKVGKSMDDLGEKAKALGVATGAALTGLGAGAAIVATQFDSASSKLQGQLGITAEEAERLGEVAKNVWKDGFGLDIGEVTTNLSRIKQQFAELSDGELQDLLKAGHTLSDLFEFEVVESMRTASVMSKTFGITGQTAMDLITVGAQRGANFNDELLDTLREYSPQFKALGYSAEEFTAILIEGSKLGIFGLDKLGDTAKESFLRFGDGSESSRTALADLGLSFEQIEADIQGGGETANKAFTAVASAIALVKDPAEKSALAIALMGTPIEDLGPEFQDFFGTVNTELGNFEGAAKSAGDVLEQSLAQKWQTFTRSSAASLEPVGMVLLDIAEDWLPRVISVVEGGAKWFNELSDEAQGAVLATGALVAAAGPLVVVGGSLISSISSIVGLFGVGGTAAGVFGGALGVLTGPVGWAALGIAAVGTAAVVTSKELSESSIEVQGWSKGVSEATAEALGGYMDLSENATLALNQMAWSGQEVTQEMANNLIGIYDQMGQQVLAEMQEDHTAQLQSMTDHFAQSSALTEVEEAEILAKIQEANGNKELSHQESQARIAEILNLAKEEKRAITESEQQEINAIQQSMTDNAIQYLTESEREQKVIYENLKNEASEITAEQAAAVVKNSVEQKEKVVTEAQDQYSKTVAEITKQRDEMGTISAEQATKLIEEAKKQRDETVKNAQDMHTKVVSEAQAQANEHVSKVDWETGEVKSKWQVMKTDVSEKMKEIGSGIKKDWSQAFKDTQDNVGKISKTAADKFSEVYDSVSGSIKDARDDVGEAIESIKGFFDGLTLKLPEIKMPKMPKFTIKGEFGLDPPKVPKIGIDWYAQGGIMTRPTAFGINGNNIMAGGEAGPEAILPLNEKNLGAIGRAIAGTMNNEETITIINQTVLNGRIIQEEISELQYQRTAASARTKGLTDV